MEVPTMAPEKKLQVSALICAYSAVEREVGAGRSDQPSGFLFIFRLVTKARLFCYNINVN